MLVRLRRRPPPLLASFDVEAAENTLLTILLDRPVLVPAAAEAAVPRSTDKDDEDKSFPYTVERRSRSCTPWRDGGGGGVRNGEDECMVSGPAMPLLGGGAGGAGDGGRADNVRNSDFRASPPLPLCCCETSLDFDTDGGLGREGILLNVAVDDVLDAADDDDDVRAPAADVDKESDEAVSGGFMISCCAASSSIC